MVTCRWRSLVAATACALVGMLWFVVAPSLAAAPEAPYAEVFSRQATPAEEVVLRGILYPHETGEPGSYEFLYAQSATECAGESKTAPGIATGNEFEQVFETLTGLQAGKQYTACVSVTSPGGTTLSAPVTFTAPIAVQAPNGLKVESIGGMTATVGGILNPSAERKAEPGSYEFLYKQSTTECEGESATPAMPASGAQAEAVSASLSELVPQTQYAVCLRATNEAGESATSAPVTFTTSMAPPAIEAEFATEVTSSSSTLNATINPEKTPTTWYFQYGTTTAYGSNSPAAPGEALGPSLGGVDVNVSLQGLATGTLYHYRVLAVGEVEGKTVVEEGADRTFRTQPAESTFLLADGRQWELVSPPNKHGAPIAPIAETGIVEAAQDGDAMTYLAFGPTELEPQGNAGAVQVISTRGTQGWSSKDVPPPHGEATGVSIGQGYEYRFFSPDLSQAIVEPIGPFTPLSSEATERTPYVRHDFTCESSPQECYSPLVTAANVPAGTKFGGREELVYGEVQFAGATPDLSHVVLQSFEVGLTSTPGDQGGLYEWANGHLQLVSIAPESEGGKPVSYLASNEPPVLGSSGQADARRAISNDGSRIFWSDVFGVGQLYVRDTVKRETLRIGTDLARYQTASSDGSRVFFLEHESELRSCDLIEVAGKLACEMALVAPEVMGVIEASEDGSYVYYVSQAALAPGASAGSPNLYMSHRSGGTWGSPRLIAVLSSSDGPDWGTKGEALGGMTARVTSSGRFLAFMSQQSLTGYDNHDAISGQPDEEVYVYDADSGTLSCASCNPTGARPEGAEYASVDDRLVGGDRIWENSAWLAANIPGWTPYKLNGALYQSRYLSDSGRLFFNSRDALVPQDVDGSWDVYEFEPAGMGDCSITSATFSPASGGCVALISAGISPQESAFVDASESGDDAFFLTESQLQKSDSDNAIDVYDAHVCSAGSPCYSPPVAPPACTTGDACKAAPSPQPSSFGSPASATFSGTGNATPSPPRAVSPRSLTRAQKLARALRACRAKPKRKRAACRRRARRRYGAKAPAAHRTGKSGNAKTTKGAR